MRRGVVRERVGDRTAGVDLRLGRHREHDRRAMPRDRYDLIEANRSRAHRHSARKVAPTVSCARDVRDHGVPTEVAHASIVARTTIVRTDSPAQPGTHGER